MLLCCVILGVILNAFNWQYIIPAHGEEKAASKVTFMWVPVAEMWELARMGRTILHYTPSPSVSIVCFVN